jgi:Spx/MgsR family transcriptional regulator
MSKLAFYGKKSCITCQKAKAFLEDQKVAFEEIPIEKTPPDRKVLEQMIKANGLKSSLNSRSALYKEKNMGQQLPDEKTAIALMLQDPNLIKRPVILKPDGALYVGFDPDSLKGFIKK